MADDGRRRHYGEFYEVAGYVPPCDGRATTWVHGNCQAESLRIVLEGQDLHTVRVPPAHELVEDDLPHLSRLLARTDVLVTQPIHDDFHDLPIGTSQLLTGLPEHARSVVVPVVRFAGLYPYQVLVRPPGEESLTPPVVPYHDLRTLARAAGGPERPPALAPRHVQAVAARSVAELQDREQRHGAVVVSDLFERPDFDLMRTINHPGNPVWSTMAARVGDRLGTAQGVVDPGLPLLDSVHAPRHPVVVETFGLSTDPCSTWWFEGVEHSDEAVQAAQLQWYAERPHVVAAGLRRHAAALRDLELVT